MTVHRGGRKLQPYTRPLTALPRRQRAFPFTDPTGDRRSLTKRPRAMPLQLVPDKRNPFKPPSANAYTKFTVGAEAADAIAVTVRLRDSNGRFFTGVKRVEVYLADDATGLTIVATAPSGGAAVTGGKTLTSLTANKHLLVATDTTGQFILTITHSGARVLYACVVKPDGTVDRQIVTFAA